MRLMTQCCQSVGRSVGPALIGPAGGGVGGEETPSHYCWCSLSWNSSVIYHVI